MFWPDDNEYYPVIIQFANDDGRLNVDYDDDNSECLDMSKETCNLPQAGSANTKTNPAVIELSSSESDVLSDMSTHFGNKSFLKHQAQGFEQSPLLNAYRKEKETFSKTVRLIPKFIVPAGANIVSSRTLYKVKQNDDGYLKLKARIAPHGNEDDLKNVLNKDCYTCTPTIPRVLDYVACLPGWSVYKADVEAAFLQIGESHRDLYVRPSRESQTRTTLLWMLLATSNGLVNSNAKWQNQLDM